MFENAEGNVEKFAHLKVTAELNLEKEKFEESKRLERQKLDADLVKLALQASGINGAETLGFMVQTNLIEDAEIRKGVIAYLARFEEARASAPN